MNQLKVYTWNPNGIRSLLNNARPQLIKVLHEQNPDIMFFPETKGNAKAETEVNISLQSAFNEALPAKKWSFYHSYSNKPGRFGNTVAVATSHVQVNDIQYSFECDNKRDDEGRIIILNIGPPDNPLFVIGLYVPNASSKLVRLKYKLDWLKQLQTFIGINSNVVVIGDINVAPTAVDLSNPQRNLQTPGYTQQERNALTMLIKECGLRDVWRDQHTDVVAFTFWDTKSRARERNIGWRIDYALVRGINVVESVICDDITGSDHCPFGITIT